MDIKDFILIGGGVLIAMVVGHGFWIAWRAKREPLRLDIVPDLISDDIDEIERLRGELPNGGARVVKERSRAHAPENLELDLAAPVLMDPTEEQPDAVPSEAEPGIARQEPAVAPSAATSKPRPNIRQAPPRATTVVDVPNTAANQSVTEPSVDASELNTSKAAVREVELRGESIVAQTPRQRRLRKAKEEPKRRTEDPSASGPAAPLRELLILNILAPKGEQFEGESLVNALRSQGLRYGEMSIFHRVDPTTKAKVFSVANAVEPGTFDLSELSTLRSPGMTFFLQLPGPGDALDEFDDMLRSARSVASALDGELRDEALTMMTGQTVEHMRQRIADFARRRLSKRA